MSEVTREDHDEIYRKSVKVTRTTDQRSFWFGRPYSEDVLTRFPQGKFSNSQYNLRVGPLETASIGEEDEFEVESVRYGNNEDNGNRARIDEVLSFDEYLELGSKKVLKVKQVRILS